MCNFECCNLSSATIPLREADSDFSAANKEFRKMIKRRSLQTVSLSRPASFADLKKLRTMSEIMTD